MDDKKSNEDVRSLISNSVIALEALRYELQRLNDYDKIKHFLHHNSVDFNEIKNDNDFIFEITFENELITRVVSIGGRIGLIY